MVRLGGVERFSDRKDRFAERRVNDESPFEIRLDQPLDQSIYEWTIAPQALALRLSVADRRQATLDLREGMTISVATARKLVKQAVALNASVGDPTRAG